MLRLFVAIVALLIAPALVNAQRCCMTNLAEEPEAQALSQGIQWATAVLFATPFTLVGLGVLWYCRGQRADAAADVASSGLHSTSFHSSAIVPTK